MNRRSVAPVQASEQSQRRPAGAYTVCVVVGTRSEAVKLAPVIGELRKQRDSVRTLVVVTSSRRTMLARALDEFGVTHDVDLSLNARHSPLSDYTARALNAFSSTFVEQRPDVLLVHGDSTTVLSACLAAHYLGIPVGHVGAGVRSESARSPFPEELNRRLASVVADLHFAPCEHAQDNLIKEGIPDDRVLLVGNTVVEAMRGFPPVVLFDEQRLDMVPWEKRRIILVALHRRENKGDTLRQLCLALSEIVSAHSDVHLIVPLHPDPQVREMIVEEMGGTPRVELLEQLGYSDMLEVIRRAALVMTDSGTIQEEACVQSRALLVLRRTTDRPEIVAAGCGLVAGTTARHVADCATRLLTDDRVMEAMTSAAHPYGDGNASHRIVQALLSRFPRQAGGAAVAEGPAPLPPVRAIER